MRCDKSEMSKIVDRWLLFEYLGPEFTPLSKPYKTREQAKKAREKYPERLHKRIGFDGQSDVQVARGEILEKLVARNICNSLGSLCHYHPIRIDVRKSSSAVVSWRSSLDFAGLESE